MTNPKYIDELIDELWNSIQIAHANYQIWWIFSGKETQPSYIDVLNEYNSYFRVAMRANLVSIVMAICHFYERKKSSCNIHNLLNACSPSAKSAVDADLNAAMPEYEPVKYVRNKIFAHREKENSIQEFFTQANITPIQLSELINTAHKILNTISVQINRRHLRLYDTDKDTLMMLNALKERSKSGPVS